ncbi:MAG: phage tail protein [Bacteroidetes bacterium]|nr:MAG: phage tail protein [Bacteroidota bacterium]
MENFGTEPFIGEITMFAGNFAPRGWALCNGQLLPISEHTALFSLIGTYYGGDGRTTFALPDLRGRVAIHPGTGPDLSTYSLGQTGGTEKVEFPRVTKVGANINAKKTISFETGSASNIQPYGTVNYIIALQGIYPSRN